MQKYVVTAAMGARVGAGSVLALDEDQLASRRHAVTDLGEAAPKVADGLTAVRANQALAFKYGEIVTVLDAAGGLNKAAMAAFAEPDSKAGRQARAAVATKRAGKKSAAKKPAAKKAAAG